MKYDQIPKNHQNQPQITFYLTLDSQAYGSHYKDKTVVLALWWEFLFW